MHFARGIAQSDTQITAAAIEMLPLVIWGQARGT